MHLINKSRIWTGISSTERKVEKIVFKDFK